MGYNFTDETKLIADIKAGIRSAFKYVFNLYFTILCNYTTNLTANFEEAKDIVQSVFISLWNNRETIVITTSLKSYLYKSCYYKYIDTYRKDKRVNEQLEKYRYQKLLELEHQAPESKTERLKMLRQAMEKLPPRCKEIFELSKFKGLKYREIADHLDISKKTVENQIGKAYATLRNELNSSS